MKIKTRVQAIDAQGKLIFDVEAHSFLYNFLAYFSSCFINPTVAQIVYTTGGGASNPSVNKCFATYGAGDDSGGLVIGTADTPIQIDQFALSAKILNADAAYGATIASLLFTDPGNTTWGISISRQFTNGPVDKSVKEVGLIVGDPGAGNFLIDRTLVPPYNLPALAVVTYAYSFSITV